MSNSIINLTKHEEEIAIKVWKAINNYLKIRVSKTSKNNEFMYSCIYEILQCDNSYNLKDEIYLQLIKQTTNNPNNASLIAGWELILLCCNTFKPSDEFTPYLTNYIVSNINQSTVKLYAESAIKALNQIVKDDYRVRELPFPIDSIINLKPILIDIYFLDSSKYIIQVTPQTTVDEINNQLANYFNIKDNKSFGLFAMDDNDIDGNDKKNIFMSQTGNIDKIYQKRPYFEKTSHFQDLLS